VLNILICIKKYLLLWGGYSGLDGLFGKSSFILCLNFVQYFVWLICSGGDMVKNSESLLSLADRKLLIRLLFYDYFTDVILYGIGLMAANLFHR